MQKRDVKQAKIALSYIEQSVSLMKEERNAYEKLDGTNVIKDLQTTAELLNQLFYYTSNLKFMQQYDLSEKSQFLAWVEEMETLLGLWKQSLEHSIGNCLDVEFWKTYDYFKYVDVDEIYRSVVRHFMSLPENLRIAFLDLPNRYPFLRGRIDYEKQDFSLIREHVEFLANNVEEYRWLYGRLADNHSRLVLNRIIQYWLEFDVNKLHSASEMAFPGDYDLNILSGRKRDVLVNCGAYTGYSTLSYIRTYGDFKKIYAFEISPEAWLMGNRLSGYGDIVMRWGSVGREAGIMYVNFGVGVGTEDGVQEEIPLKVVTLDEDIQEKITVLKLDIKGAEQDAIRGATGHIQAEKPRMMISAYYKPEDLFEIPRLIESIRPGYKYYLRFKGKGCLWPCDYVLYAV